MFDSYVDNMTDKETIEALALQVEQLSEDVRGLTYTVQDLVAVLGLEAVEHDKFGLVRYEAKV